MFITVRENKNENKADERGQGCRRVHPRQRGGCSRCRRVRNVPRDGSFVSPRRIWVEMLFLSTRLRDAEAELAVGNHDHRANERGCLVRNSPKPARKFGDGSLRLNFPLWTSRIPIRNDNGNFHASGVFLMFQVHLPSHIHGGNGDKINSEGIYTEQVHLPAESLELAGLRGDYQRIRHHRHGSRQSGRSQDVQGVEST